MINLGAEKSRFVLSIKIQINIERTYGDKHAWKRLSNVL